LIPQLPLCFRSANTRLIPALWDRSVHGKLAWEKPPRTIFSGDIPACDNHQQIKI
jgi:hypothetical protein